MKNKNDCWDIRCEHRGILFGYLFNIPVYYCKTHFKMYERFMNKFKLRNYLLRLKNGT